MNIVDFSGFSFGIKQFKAKYFLGAKNVAKKQSINFRDVIFLSLLFKRRKTNSFSSEIFLFEK